MKIDDVLMETHKETGLLELGQGPSLDWLELFIDNLGDIPDVYMQTAFNRMKKAVKHRLELHKHQPKYRPLDRPIFIVGLSRSGTTHLHELLSLQFRSPTTTEARWPIHMSIGDKDWATEENKGLLGLVDMLDPDFKKIHQMRHDSPEEVRVLLEPSFMNFAWPIEYENLEYAKRLDQADMTEAWKVMGRVLNMLGDDRWVLKDPTHLGNIDTLLDVFPDALIVWTHRDPATCTASLASLITSITKVASGGLTERYPERLGEYLLNKHTADLRWMHAVLDGRENVINVGYDELITSPIEVCARIIEAAGEEFTSESAVAEWASSHKKDAYGKHEYRASDFGLDENEMKEVFENIW